jgi:Tol biopolymer transport system component
MMRRSLFCMALLALATIDAANAYELATHARLTQAAFLRSVLSDKQFLQGLGIDASLSNQFGEYYYDVSGSSAITRAQDDFEKFRMPDNGVDFLKVNGWLMRGAIREDDAEGESNPQDDPYNPHLKRPLHHFFDPAFNRPLSVTCLTLDCLSALDPDVHKAPDWATGSRNAFSSPNGQEYARRNHFTVFDAREAMYRALTGRDNQGVVVAATEAERQKYWATTFRSLGDVVHLVQDMGQPQHTRNDPHAGKSPEWLTGYISGHTSVYEKYIETRATGAGSYKIDGTKVTPLPLTYEGYPIPAFTKYSDFWSTRNGVTRRGLADYSNHGFFTAGTNLGGNVYSFPSNNAASYVKESTAGLLPKKPLQTISFLRGNVHDANLNTDASLRMTTESLFDAFLFDLKTYSLNRHNYDDMAAQLIPRAVAYSAGLINYFFRGKLGFETDSVNPGKYIIKNLGPEDMKGTFTLYYDAKDGMRYPVAGDMPGETWIYRSIAANGELGNLGFVPPVEPAPKSPGVYTLVFHGDMGEEEEIPSSAVGAVAATIVKPPSRIAFLRYIGPYIGKDNYDIHVVNPDGTGERNITNKPGSYDDVAWSPDGTRLAFVSNREGRDEIYVLKVDTGDILNVSKSSGYDSRPTWSPDGRRLVFQGDSSGNSDIYIAEADGSSSVNLTNTPDDYEWAPNWSPDGRKILFDSYYSGYGLAVMDAKGGIPRQITVSPPGEKYDYNPRWSPDGSRIAFESIRDGDYEVYAMEANGDSQVRMTNSSFADWFPRWSPDGTRIAFVRSNGSDKIHVMNADGSGQTLLTNTPEDVSDWYPSWSPDGEKVVFISNRGYRGMDIFLMDADGENPQFLTRGSWPIWSSGELGVEQNITN